MTTRIALVTLLTALVLPSAVAQAVGMVRDGDAITVDSKIVTRFNLWFPKDERQRVLWPSTVRL